MFGPAGCYSLNMSTRSQRAEARRQKLTGGIAHSHEEMAKHDLEFWLAVPPIERLRAACVLQEEIRALKNDGPIPRLQGSTGGVRLLRS